MNEEILKIKRAACDALCGRSITDKTRGWGGVVNLKSIPKDALTGAGAGALYTFVLKPKRLQLLNYICHKKMRNSQN